MNSLKDTILNYAGIINEDNPENYIKTFIKEVLSKSTLENSTQLKNNYIDFNKKRKRIDLTRVEKDTGKPLSKDEFTEQAINFFDKVYSKYSQYRQIVLDALDDY